MKGLGAGGAGRHNRAVPTDEQTGPTGVQTDPMVEVGEDTSPGQTVPNDAVRLDWSAIVAGLRADAAKAPEPETRANLLAIAGAWTWQLIGDETDAGHLFDEAISAAPDLFFAHRERALLALRSGRPLGVVMADLAESLATDDAPDTFRRVRGRTAMYALAGGRRLPGVAQRATALSDLVARDLVDSPLLPLWDVMSRRETVPADVAEPLQQARRACRSPQLRAALLVWLAAGMISEEHIIPDKASRPWRLLEDAVKTWPHEPLYRLLLIRENALRIRSQVVALEAQLAHDSDPGLALRAALLAATDGRFEQALTLFASVPSPLAPWVAFSQLRVAVEARRWSVAGEALDTLESVAQAPLTRTLIALERASLASLRNDAEGMSPWLAVAAEAGASSIPASLVLDAPFLKSQDYRAWLHSVGDESPHSRRVRAWVLDTRLNSPEEAVEAYRALASEDSADAFAARSLVRALMDAGEWQRAMDQAAALATNAQPDVAAHLTRLALDLCRFECGDVLTAADLGLPLVASSPDDWALAWDVALMRCRVGDFAYGGQLLAQVMDRVDRRDQRALLACDRLVAREGLDAADLTGLAEANRESPAAMSALEIECVAREQHDVLLAQIERIDVLPPRDTTLLAAECMMRGRENERALALLTEWLSHHPEDVAARHMFARAARRSGRRDRGRDLRPMLTLPTGYDPICAALEAWWDDGCSLEAAEAASHAIASASDRRVVWATTLCAVSGPDRLQCALRLLACAPDDHRLQALVERLVLTDPASEDALRLFLDWARSGDELDRDFMLHRLARSYLAQGRAKDALVVWRKLREIHPHFVPGLAGLAEAAMQCDEVEEAFALVAEVENNYGFRNKHSPKARLEVLGDLANRTQGALRALLLLACCDLAWEIGKPRWVFLAATQAALIAPDAACVRRQLLASSPGCRQETLPPEFLACALVLPVLSGQPVSGQPITAALRDAVVDVDDPELIATSIHFGRHHDDPHRLLDAVRAWSACAEDPGVLLHLDLLTAELAEHTCSDLEGTAEAFQRATRRAPRDGWIASQYVRTALASATFSEQRWRDLRDALGTGPEDCDGLMALGEITTGPASASVYRRVLEIDPTYLPAEWGLLALGRAPDLGAILARRARRRRSPGLMAEAARLFLDAGDEATGESMCTEALRWDCIEEIVAVGGPKALLDGLLIGTGRAVESLTIGEDLLGRAKSTAVRVRLLESAAETALGPARSPSVARQALFELVSLRTGDWALLARAGARARAVGDWPRAKALLELELVQAEAGAGVLSGVLQMEWAELERAHGVAADKAAARLTRASHRAADPALARRVADWITLDLGGPDALSAARLAELDGLEDRRRIAEVQSELGFIDEFFTHNGVKALTHYRAALVAAPDHAAALLGVLRLAERVGQAASEIRPLLALAPRLESDLRPAALLRAALLTELVEQRWDVAEGLYTDLLGQDLTPDIHGAGRLGLQACLAAQERFADLPAAFAPSPGEAADLARQVGVLLQGQGRPNEDDALATWLTEAFRATSPRASEAAAHVAEHVHDAHDGAELLRLSLVADLLVQDHGASPTEFHLRHLERLAVFDPSDPIPPLLWQAQAGSGSAGELAAIETCLRAAPSGPPQVAALVDLVRHFAVTGEDDKLWEALGRLREEAPSLAVHHHTRAALGSDSDDPAHVADRLERESLVATSTARKTELLLRAARLRLRHTGEVGRAVDDLTAVLEADPQSAEAFEELRDIFTAHGNLTGLFELLEIRHRIVTDPAEKVASLQRMAKLAYDRLNDLERAAWCHSEIVGIDPLQIQSYRILAEIRSEQRDFEGAARAMEEVAVLSEQPTLRLKTHLQLAKLYRQQLNNDDGAEAHLRAIIKQQPDHAEAVSELLQIAEARHNWDEAVLALEPLVDGAPAGRRSASLHLRLARALQARGAPGDLTRAEGQFRRSVEVAPGDPTVVAAFADLVRSTGRVSELNALAKRVTDGMGLMSAATDEAVALRALFGVLNASGLDDRAYAAAASLRALGHQTQSSEEVRIARAGRRVAWRELSAVPPEETACVFPIGLNGTLVELMRVVDPAISRIFPSRAKQLGAHRRTRVPRARAHVAFVLGDFYSRPDIEVFACLADGSTPVVEPGPTPQLLLPKSYPAEPTSDDFTWLVGYTLAPAVMGLGASSRLPEEIWADVLALLIRRSVPDFLAGHEAIGTEPAVVDEVHSRLPRKVAIQVDQLTPSLAGLGFDQLIHQRRLLQVSFASLAMLSCRQLDQALAATERFAGRPATRGAVRFLLSQDWERLTQRAEGP